jgi:hypothetical protein
MTRDTGFSRTEMINKMSREDTFHVDDVGITSPYSDSYIRVKKDGIIEIYAGNGTGIFLNPSSRSITFMADCVKFITNNEDGLRWNDMSFNSQATDYTEPSLVPFDQETRPTIYKDLDDYYEDDK